MTALTVRRVLNNNVVQAIDDRGKQYVLMGRGIGHRTGPGQPVVERLIEQTFVSEGGHQALRRLAEFVNDTPLDHLLVAGEAVALAQRELGITPKQSLLLPLADHLSFAIQRAAEGTHAGYELHWELRQIYPKELLTGQRILDLIEARLGVRLPPGEAMAFALHLVSAQFASPDFARASRMTELIHAALATVGERCQIEIDQESLAASRFVTHLRFLVARLEAAPQPERPAPSFMTSFNQDWPDAAACARELRSLFEQKLTCVLHEDDVAYLTLHIARLVESTRTR